MFHTLYISMVCCCDVGIHPGNSSGSNNGSSYSVGSCGSGILNVATTSRPAL